MVAHLLTVHLAKVATPKKSLNFSNTKIIALDRDKDTEKIALDFEKKFKNRFLFKNKKFSEINDLNLRKEKIKAVVFDLGYSYTQIKDSKKGLSFDAVLVNLI